MAAPVRLGRKRPLPACPNPLFVRWLTEWRDEAASRGRRTRFVFQKVSSGWGGCGQVQPLPKEPHGVPCPFPPTPRRCAPSAGTRCPSAAGRKLRSSSTSETDSVGCWTSGYSSMEHPAVSASLPQVPTLDTLTSGSPLPS
jgi:hypothetical protein